MRNIIYVLLTITKYIKTAKINAIPPHDASDTDSSKTPTAIGHF